MEYLKIMAVSTKANLYKCTDAVFYIGGVTLGLVCYLTGLTPKELGSAFIIILLDIASRVWAEKANKRPILSRRMYSGFVGKVMAYVILLTATNLAPVVGEYLRYVILSGFSIIEIRSIYENLVDAKIKNLDITIIGDKINQEIDNFRGKPNEEIKPSNENSPSI